MRWFIGGIVVLLLSVLYCDVCVWAKDIPEYTLRKVCPQEKCDKNIINYRHNKKNLHKTFRESGQRVGVGRKEHL